jgi:putative CRISPR-associated protein (TIGR02619 family)
MGVAVITTTGISLKENARRWLASEGKEPSSLREDHLRRYVLAMDGEGRLRDVSAEINSLARIMDFVSGKWKEEIDAVHFVLSDTEDMDLVFPVLKWTVERRLGIKNVGSSKVEKLNYQESRFKAEGIRNLLRVMARLIEEYRRRGKRVVANATGGFKAESAYATVLCQLYGVDVFYIHERFRDIVHMPPIPVSLDVDFWQGFERDIEKYASGVSDEENERLMKRLPRSFPYLVERKGDGKWYLNPAGETFYLGFLRMKEERELSKAKASYSFKR